MKTIYVSELGYPDGYQELEPSRLPQAYISNLRWFMSSYKTLDSNVEPGDVLIFQTPTDNELANLKKITEYIDNHKTLITQESCIYDWQEWPAKEQELYVNILSKCTAFMYHSEYDRRMMSVYTDKFIKYPGCTNVFYKIDKAHEGHISIPSPIKRYQTGLVSHALVADSLPDAKIYAMSYRRPMQAGSKLLTFPDTYNYKHIETLPFMSKEDWFGFVYNSKFGVDIHRNFSGGNVCLEYASLGTPLIGNIELDCQRDLFPLTSFDYTDYDNIRKAIRRLDSDAEFHKEVSEYALTKVQELYSSDKITKDFEQDLEKVLS